MVAQLKSEVKYFIKKRSYLISLLLAAMAGYGYQLLHGTCGIDDISIGLYFEKGLGVAIGRWPFYLINKVIPIAGEYHPFIGDFITVLLLMVSAVVWCALLRMVIKRELPILCYIVFSVIFLDYSLIAEVFVFYLQNGLGFVYLLTGLALFGTYYLFQFPVSVKRSLGIKAAILTELLLAISFYESAANLYLSGAILLVYIGILTNVSKNEVSFKRLLGYVVFLARFLVYAMILRRIIRTVIMRIFKIMPYTFYRSASLSWLFKGGIGKAGENFSVLLEDILENYFVAGVSYFPITLFVLCSIVFIGYTVWYCMRRKCFLSGLSGVGFYLSMFVLSFVQGSVVTYRACQIFSVFIGVVLLGITDKVIKLPKIKRNMGLSVLFCILLLSVLDLNKWFELDYRKTEYEMSVLEEIAQELQSGAYHIEEKPIVVVGEFELDESIAKEYGYAQNSNSIINWSVKAFAMYYGYNVPIRQLFEYLGYSFQWADAELCEEVFEKYYPLNKELYDISPLLEEYTEQYALSEQYPNEGYIEETDTYIVIKL